LARWDKSAGRGNQRAALVGAVIWRTSARNDERVELGSARATAVDTSGKTVAQRHYRLIRNSRLGADSWN
jgi:hypothetical protein